MARRTRDLLAAAALALLCASACSIAGAKPKEDKSTSASSADAGRATPGSKADRAAPDAGGELPIAEVGDCPAICAKLLRCKAGPFDTASDCGDACEGAIDDRRTAKTYRCVAKAKDCAHVTTCAK